MLYAKVLYYELRLLLFSDRQERKNAKLLRKLFFVFIRQGFFLCSDHIYYPV